MAGATKVDLYKERKADYVAPRKPVLVNIPAAAYLAVAGKGEPGGEQFSEKVGALYAAAFTTKMRLKFAGRDYAVCKLEGLWWVDGKPEDWLTFPRSEWHWKLLIRTPDFIKAKDLKQTIEDLKAKGKGARVAEVKLETIREGQCVQVLHVGPYAKETETIARMQEFAEEQGLKFHGLHHEIYLSDPRRVAPAKLKTILRHPVR